MWRTRALSIEVCSQSAQFFPRDQCFLMRVRAEFDLRAAAGEIQRRAGSPEHDGSARHQGAAPGLERRRKGTESRELRRVEGESLSESSRSADAERRAKSNNGCDMVGQAAAGDCGGVFEVCLWLRAKGRTEGDVDGDGD